MSEVGQERRGNHYSPGPSDHAVRELRREMVATMLVTKTPHRRMAENIERDLGRRPGKGTIGRDIIVLQRRWIERANASYDRLLAEQGAMLDALTRAWMPKALSGDEKAADQVRWILAARANLYGLDMLDRHRAKLEERMAEVEEQKVAMVAKALELTMAELGLDPIEVRPRLASNLRALEAG
jgi:hypothetical protein